MVAAVNRLNVNLAAKGPWQLPRPSRWKVSFFYGQGPGPDVKSKKPETVPLNCDDAVIVPVVLTTTTKSDWPGTTNEYDAFGIVVPNLLFRCRPDSSGTGSLDRSCPDMQRSRCPQRLRAQH